MRTTSIPATLYTMEDKGELNIYYDNEYNIQDIPNEIMINIISYLDDTYTMLNVNKNINNIYNSHNLYSYMIQKYYKYSYGILVKMIDAEYVRDMWKYFYDNMKNNKKYIHYYTKGLKSESIFKNIYSNSIEFMLILLNNDKIFRYNKHDTIHATRMILSGKVKDNMSKILFDSCKFRKHIKICNFCDHLVERHLFQLSIYLASKYLDDAEYKTYMNKHKDSVSMNLILYPSTVYTQEELYNEIGSLTFSFISSTVNIDRIINRINENVKRSQHEGRYLQYIMDIINYKYKIKNIINDCAQSFFFKGHAISPGTSGYIVLECEKCEILSCNAGNTISIKYTMNGIICGELMDIIYDCIVRNRAHNIKIPQNRKVELFLEKNIIYVNLLKYLL